MPLTVQFGPWAPDQADTPVQVPDTQGPMVVPLADCLNVYYANGSYKSIPSPAASSIDGNTIAPLNAQALNAFSYFDSVAQQETIFVGTPVGIQQLQSNGTWSVVSFITSQTTGLFGVSMSFSAGNFANNNNLRGNTLTFTTGALGGKTAGTSFVAGLVIQGFGVFQTNFTGFSGLTAEPNGSLINSDISFGTLLMMQDNGTGRSEMIVSTPTNPSQSAFTTITSGLTTLNASAAAYAYSASTQQASWTWAQNFGFSPGSTYTVVLA